MYRQLLENYIAAYAEEGATVATVDIWPDCDVGDDTTLSVTVARNQEEPRWLLYDGSDVLLARINVGRL